MKRWIAATSLICAIDCGKPHFPSATPARQAHEEALTADEKLRADDRAVYDALVVGYARDGLILGSCFPPPPDQRHPLSAAELKRGSSARSIYLQPFTRRYEVGSEFRDSQYPWEITETGQRRPVLLAHSIVEDFNARNQHRASLGAYAPPYLSLMKSPIKHRGFNLEFSLPGYSIAKNRALVCTFCSPKGDSMPPCDGGEYNYLEKRNGEWHLVAHTPMWYC
jgi:hypothetical protein